MNKTYWIVEVDGDPFETYVDESVACEVAAQIGGTVVKTVIEGKTGSQACADEWRALAHQFDAHRMRAIAHLKAVADHLPADMQPAVHAFLSASPVLPIGKEGAQKELAGDPWKAAIDHELVTMGCTADSFSSPKEALNALIQWHIAVATDPMVNGGHKLVPMTSAMSNADLLEWLKQFGFAFHYDKFGSGSGYGLLSKPYGLENFRAALDAAQGSSNSLET